jgi:hypothetical protein
MNLLGGWLRMGMLGERFPGGGVSSNKKKKGLLGELDLKFEEK